ncbi:MAG: class I tRNA ligase family protein, partial [Woeseiales bacterium]
MTKTTRRIMVSSALPYANGRIHMGHLVEYIQSDIWVRFQRLRGHLCTYVCAADAHGTPIMISARKEGIDPEALVARAAADQHQDLQAFGVDFDNFYTTHSPENELLVVKIFEALRDAGHIYTKVIEQAFD